MISDAGLFADYFAGVRRRTLSAARALPDEAMDWGPRPGEFTAGDILRHLAAAQRMYLSAFRGEGWRYPGHDRSLAPDRAAALVLLEDRQRELDALLPQPSSLSRYPSTAFFAPEYSPLALSPSASPHITASSHTWEPGTACAATYPKETARPRPIASGVAQTASSPTLFAASTSPIISGIARTPAYSVGMR